MAHIGTFTRTADGYLGRLRTLTLDVELTLVPVDRTDAEPPITAYILAWLR